MGKFQQKHLAVDTLAFVTGYAVELNGKICQILARNGEYYRVRMVISGRIVQDLYLCELSPVKEA